MTGITAATDPYQRRILYTGSKLYWMKMDIAEKCPRPNREFGVEVYKPNGELIWAGGSKVMPKFKYHLNSQPWTSAHLTNLIEEKTTYSLTSGRDLWVLPDFGPPTPFQGGGHKMGLKRKDATTLVWARSLAGGSMGQSMPQLPTPSSFIILN